VTHYTYRAEKALPTKVVGENIETHFVFETNRIIFEIIKRKGFSNLYIQQQQQQQKWSCKNTGRLQKSLNPLKPELNPICYLLALLGAHHFLHVSRIRV